MDCVVAYDTHVGIKKSNNEDSLLIKVVQTLVGKIVFAAVCDGMGGLDFGELASKEVVLCLSEWFYREMPLLIQHGFTQEKLFKQWDKALQDINMKLYQYGVEKVVQLGTTITGILIVDKEYFVLHVGATRFYKLNSDITCLTQDHSFGQREIVNGRMTEAQARAAPRKNLLLQAVGTSNLVVVEFLSGRVENRRKYDKDGTG